MMENLQLSKYNKPKSRIKCHIHFSTVFRKNGRLLLSKTNLAKQLYSLLIVVKIQWDRSDICIRSWQRLISSIVIFDPQHSAPMEIQPIYLDFGHELLQTAET